LKVSSRLKELSVAAKASGPDKVKYLASDLYLKASAAQMEGDYQTANLIFTHLADLVPEAEFVMKKYAVSLIRTGDLEKAQEILDKLDSDPELFREFNVLLRKRKIEKIRKNG